MSTVRLICYRCAKCGKPCCRSKGLKVAKPDLCIRCAPYSKRWPK